MMTTTTTNIDYQPKISLIITPLIPISLLILFSLFTGKFGFDLLYIVGLFAGIYYIVLFPLLLKICNILISKKLFIFPLMLLGAHTSLSLIYFIISILQNIYNNSPMFDYVFYTVARTFTSPSTFSVSFLLSLIFWSISSFQPKFKAKYYQRNSNE